MVMKNLSILKIGLFSLTLLLISALAVNIYAASSASVKVNSKVNSSSTSTCTSKVENHVRVNVNGTEKVVDEVKEGCDVNSSVKVEAKSENGQTTINITSEPQTAKVEKNSADNKAGATPTVATSSVEVKDKVDQVLHDQEEKSKSILETIGDFIRDILDALNFLN